MVFTCPGTTSVFPARCGIQKLWIDRKSTRLNSSHANISYAVFCLKKHSYQGHACQNHPTRPSFSITAHCSPLLQVDTNNLSDSPESSSRLCSNYELAHGLHPTFRP